MKKLFYVVVATLFVSACSRYSSNGDDLYLKSRNGVPLVVPAPLTSAHVSHFYDLPPQNQNARVSIAPPVDVITT